MLAQEAFGHQVPVVRTGPVQVGPQFVEHLPRLELGQDLGHGGNYGYGQGHYQPPVGNT